MFATGSVLAIGAVILLAGATIAPTAASIYAMVDRFAPAGTAHRGVLVGGDRGLDRRGARRGGRRPARAELPAPTAAFAFGGAAGAVAVLIAFAQVAHRLDDAPGRHGLRRAVARGLISRAETRPRSAARTRRAGRPGARRRRHRCRRDLAPVVKATAGHGGAGVLAAWRATPGCRRRARGRRERPGRPSSSDPSRLDRVRENAGPAPCDREREHDVEQLGIRVRLRAAPSPPRPLQVARSGSPPRCIPDVRYTKRSGPVISAVSRYGASTLIANTWASPSTVSTRGPR